jgi:undecaprenyl-diphosphatase
VIIALLLKNVVENSFGGDFVIYGFLITAIILIISQNIESGRNNNKNGEFLSKTNNIQYNNITNIGVGYGQAVLIGVAQGLAIFPGISRSGSTIATGLLSGVNKNNAADFSFLLSIPVILGGLVFELKDIVKYGADLSFSLGELFVGFVVAFISGLLAITVMLRLVKNKKLTGFSIYLFLLVLFLMLNKFVLGWF